MSLGKTIKKTIAIYGASRPTWFPAGGDGDMDCNSSPRPNINPPPPTEWEYVTQEKCGDGFNIRGRDYKGGWF